MIRSTIVYSLLTVSRSRCYLVGGLFAGISASELSASTWTGCLTPVNSRWVHSTSDDGLEVAKPQWTVRIIAKTCIKQLFFFLLFLFCSSSSSSSSFSSSYSSSSFGLLPLGKFMTLYQLILSSASVFYNFITFAVRQNRQMFPSSSGVAHLPIYVLNQRFVLKQ